MPTSDNYTARYHAGLDGVRVSDARGDPVEDAIATIIGDSLSELLAEMDRHGMERESCVFWIERKRPARAVPESAEPG